MDTTLREPVVKMEIDRILFRLKGLAPANIIFHKVIYATVRYVYIVDIRNH